MQNAAIINDEEQQASLYYDIFYQA